MIETNIKNHILSSLKSLEEKRNIKILYAVLCGSRASGIENINTDYDIKFVYVRKPYEYLTIEQNPVDSVCAASGAYNENTPIVIDMIGYDLRRFLRLLFDSKAEVFEMLKSPCVLIESNTINEIANISDSYFSPVNLAHHYYQKANTYFSIFNKIITDDTQPETYTYKRKIRLKTILAILKTSYIEKYEEMPPVILSELIEIMIDDFPEGSNIDNYIVNWEKAFDFIDIKKHKLNNAKINACVQYYGMQHAYDRLNEIFIKAVKEFDGDNND